MPWFRVDDSAHTHPKLRRAGTAAIGLWTLGGCYSAHYLTDGRVHAHFIKSNATRPQLSKLAECGLWHPAGHDCPRCPQPTEGDYQIHDYLVYNMSRAQAEAGRAKAADKKRRQRAGDDSPSNRDGNDDDSNANRDGNDDESNAKSPPDSGDSAGHGPASPGDADQPRARASMPCHASPSLPTEEKDGATPRAHEPDGIPEPLRPLADALYHDGIRGIRWILRGDEPFRIQNLMVHKGVEAMVIAAGKRFRRAREPIENITYFIGTWTELQNLPAESSTLTLRSVPGLSPEMAAALERRKARQ